MASQLLDHIVAVTRAVVMLPLLSTVICCTVTMPMFPFTVLTQYALPDTGVSADTP